MKKIFLSFLITIIAINCNTQNAIPHPLNFVSIAAASYIANPYISRLYNTYCTGPSVLLSNWPIIDKEESEEKSIEKIEWCIFLRLAHKVNYYRISSSKHKKTTPLHFAVKNNKKKLALFLLNKGANIEANDHLNNKPLHTAVKSNNYDMVNFLLNKGANIEAINNHGQTPLNIAVKKNDNEMVKLLLNKNANIIVRDKDKKMPMYYAVENNNYKIATDLFKYAKKKGDFFNDDEHKIIINCAIYGDQKCRYKIENSFEYMPIHCAVQNKNYEIVKFLIKNGAEVDECGKDLKMPLHYAVKNNDYKMVKILIKSKYIIINDGDKYGVSPLLAALLDGNKNIAKILIKKSIKEDYEHQSVIEMLHNIIEVITSQRFGSRFLYNNKRQKININFLKESINSLIEYGIDINRKSDNGETVLHYAVKQDNKDVTKFLLKNKKVDIEAKTNDGFTPLHLAILNNNIKHSYYYLNKEKILNNNNEIILLLHEKKADFYAKDNKDKTPIDYCSNKNILPSNI